MLHLPAQAVACPHCKALAKYNPLLSFTCAGTAVWTDGKLHYIGLPDTAIPPVVVKCYSCGECYWLNESEGPWRRKMKQSSTRPRRSDQSSRSTQHASDVREPEEREYYEALRKGFAKDPLQERFVRTLAWWKRNDSFRIEPPRGLISISDPCRDNLNALAQLLNEADENDRVLKAEVHRQLGEFDKAKEILSRITSPEHRSAVRQLRDLCNRGDACVQLLSFEESQDVEALIQLLSKDIHRTKRIPAILALERIGPHAKNAIPMLVELLQDRDMEIAFRARDALREIGGWFDEGLPMLLELLKDERHMIRSIAVRMLGEMGPRARPAIPPLRAALTDETFHVRTFAARALQTIEGGALQTAAGLGDLSDM